ncbi:hypothetical protein GCM10027610_000240 [Dactylosporangium cerinum]
MELRNRLADATGLTLPATMVFDHPTPAVLTTFLCDELVPRAADAELPTAEDLDRLDGALAALPADDIERVRIVLRLESLLSRHARPGGSEGGTELIDKLGSVSNDELFALVDQDLGLA